MNRQLPGAVKLPAVVCGRAEVQRVLRSVRGTSTLVQAVSIEFNRSYTARKSLNDLIR